MLKSNWYFPEICLETFFEDGHVTDTRRRQWKKSSRKSCGQFSATKSGLKIRLNWSPEAPDIAVPLQP